LIVSHKHKFIFLKTTKTAGTSLEIALSRYCGPRDIITPISETDEIIRQSLGYRGPQNYKRRFSEYRLRNLKEIIRGKPALKYYNHMRASEIRDELPSECWSTYFKFSIVRNPFDYAVSRYFFHNRGIWSKEHFQTWLIENCEKLTINRKITHIDEKLAVNFMIRYEYLIEDTEKLSLHCSLAPELSAELKTLKAKGHLRPKEATTSEMFKNFPAGIAIVREFCAEEINNYGYRL
jgi:hypothetical protein